MVSGVAKGVQTGYWKNGRNAAIATIRGAATHATGPGGALGAPVTGRASTVRVSDCALRATVPEEGTAASAKANASG